MSPSKDETAIRAVVQRWMDANLSGDHATLLELLDDDVVFLTADRAPFGKEAFEEVPANPPQVTGGSEVLEVEVFGDHAHLACFVDITLTPFGAAPQRYAGRTQTVMCKGPDGAWRIWRDANFVKPLE